MEKIIKSMTKIRGTVVVALFILLFSVSSCMKNGKYDIDFSNVGASVDIPLAAANANGVVPFTFSAGSNTFPVYVNMASPAVLSKATSVTVAIDTAFLNSYNSDNGTSYTLLPDSDYSATSFNLTIPAGQRLDSVEVTFNIGKIDADPSISYVLPFTITQSSEPIEQWNHLLIGVTVTP
jgi:hypothetical protein